MMSLMHADPCFQQSCVGAMNSCRNTGSSVFFRTETVVGSGRNTNLLQDLAGAIVQAVASVVLAQTTMTKQTFTFLKHVTKLKNDKNEGTMF